MSIFRCKSCNGIYSDTTGDGATYFHVCAPIDDPDTANSRKRLNGRNENLAAPRGNRPPALRAEGEGVECLNAPGLDEPAWITRMKERAAREGEE